MSADYTWADIEAKVARDNEAKAQRERYADAGEELVAAAQALIDCWDSDSGFLISEFDLVISNLKAAIAKTKLFT